MTLGVKRLEVKVTRVGGEGREKEGGKQLYLQANETKMKVSGLEPKVLKTK